MVTARRLPRGTWPLGALPRATAPDPAAVARILAGDMPPGATTADRAAALAAADRWGRSAAEVAVRLGCTTRTVQRHRARRRRASTLREDTTRG